MNYLGLLLFWLAVQTPLDRQLGSVDFEQRLGTSLPLNLTFQDDAGRSARLGAYFGARPVVLVFAYYTCPNLCHIVLNGTLESLRNLPGTIGKDFDVVVVSIDPKDTPHAAHEQKQIYATRYARPESAAGWHFLTGKTEEIHALTEAAGYRYFYDAGSAQFAHPSGLLVVTPTGRISRYFLGIEYPPKEMRAALAEAAQDHVGSLTERLLLLCFHYNPSLGRYGNVITRVIQVAGLGTVVAIGLFMLRSRRSPV